MEAMKARLKTIQSGTTDLAALSSPLEMRALPFPQSFPPLPTDRFRIKADGTFDYMGREKFHEIYQLWDSAFLQHSGLLLINVYGTPGSVDLQKCAVRAAQPACRLCLIYLLAVLLSWLQLWQEPHACCTGSASDAAQTSGGLHFGLL